jgi:hypothetical protein
MKYVILNNFSNYKIYENGKIYNIDSKEYIKPYFNKQSKQYTVYMKNNDGSDVRKKVGRLIYEIFKGDLNIDEQIIFIDGDNQNFNISNLSKDKFYNIIKNNNINDNYDKK